MSETATVETPSLEQELSTFLNPPADKSAPSGDTATPEAASPSELPAPETKEEAPAAEPSDIDKKLAEIPDAPEVKEEAKSPLTDIQQQILAAFPNPETATQVVTESGYFQQLNTALQNNDFETVEQMFAPEALEGFKEHFYQKYATEIVDRWIAEKEGTAPVQKGMSALERKIAQLEQRLAERDNAAVKETQQAQRQRLTSEYNTHLNSVFDRFNFSPADRRYVAADITDQVSRDPRLMSAYQSGNMAALNTVIKKAIHDYSVKDQQSAKQTQQTLQRQEQKKPLVQGQTASVIDSLPDNVKDVPKGKEDAWMMEKLNKLFGK